MVLQKADPALGLVEQTAVVIIVNVVLRADIIILVLLEHLGRLGHQLDRLACI